MHRRLRLGRDRRPRRCTIRDVALFLDRHDVAGASAQDIAAAHELDVAVQDRYGVRYVTYWFDDNAATVFCLAEGPDREAVECVHREAHGLMAENVIEVGLGPINEFLGEPPRHPVGEAYTNSAVRAIFFTDFCGSTQLTQELGDEEFLRLLHEHDDIVRQTLGRRGGTEVKHTGDGIMASFTSASGAVETSVDVQRCLRDRNAASRWPLHLRIGISVGEPVAEGDDLFGASVQLAARLCAVAPRGGVAVSSAVRDLCVGKRFGFDAMGAFELKGFAEPVPVFEVAIPEG
jgi:class 3 adenylate cyclase